LKTCKDQKNPELSKTDEAMDFLSMLNNARYAEFKTTYLNILQLKAYNPSDSLNEIFTLANTYLKPKAATTGGGFASTFMTTVDTIDKTVGGEVAEVKAARIIRERVETNNQEARVISH
jgi:hypothetical protein